MGLHRIAGLLTGFGDLMLQGRNTGSSPDLSTGVTFGVELPTGNYTGPEAPRQTTAGIPTSARRETERLARSSFPPSSCSDSSRNGVGEQRVLPVTFVVDTAGAAP